MSRPEKSVFVQVVEFAAGGRKLDEQMCVVHSLAQKAATYAESARENAAYLAEAYARYAKDCAEGRVFSSTPMGSSAGVGLVQDAAKYEAYREAFCNAFYAAFGRSFSSAREAMDAAKKAEVRS